MEHLQGSSSTNTDLVRQLQEEREDLAMKATALSENMKSMAVELDYVRSQNEKLGRENVYYK